MREEITRPGQRAATDKSRPIRQEQTLGKPAATTESASGLMVKQLKIGQLITLPTLQTTVTDGEMLSPIIWWLASGMTSKLNSPKTHRYQD